MAGYVAIDLGASSGRILLGKFSNAGVELQEIHRFANDVVQEAGHLRWDVRRLWTEVERGLAACDGSLEGVGVASWGLDFGLLDAGGTLLSNPVAYRDARTEGVPSRVFERVPAERIFATTGIECMRVNSLYQLEAAREALDGVHTLLMIPDLFRYWLGGERVCEYTIATTTQMVDCRTGTWAAEMLAAIGLPQHILPPIVAPGTRVGTLRAELRDAAGLDGEVPVIAVCGHDTASAVVAVPGLDRHSAFVSSGTWSLMGVETTAPVLSDEAFRLGFTNEGGAAGTVRLQKTFADSGCCSRAVASGRARASTCRGTTFSPRPHRPNRFIA